jgi:outer membrane protein TolC
MPKTPMKTRLITFFTLALAVRVTPASIAGDLTAQREISMRECVESALRGNVDISVGRIERDMAGFDARIEEAAFLPKFTGDLSFSRSLTPSESVLVGGLALDQRNFKLDLGMKDLLPAGTALSLDFDSRRQESNSAVSLLSPEYTTSLAFTARQPLLKNRGREATEAPLLIARAGHAAKNWEWMEKAQDVVASARTAYLSLYVSHGEAQVRGTSLTLAEKLLAEIRARVEAGAAAPMDLLPAEAAAAARREELLRAEAALRNAADDLRTVLGAGLPPDWDADLLPAGLPPDAPLPPGPEDTFEEAMRRRPELAALAERKAQAGIREAAARNRAMPSLDLTLSAGLSGLSGTPNPSPLFPSSPTAFQGSYGDSLDTMFSGKYYNWFVGLTTEIPWRFDREKAEWARARATVEEQRLLEEKLVRRIRTDVRKGRRDLESAIGRISAAEASTAASGKKLEAEEKKLSLGASTAVQVLQFQQDLSEARLALLRARADAWLARTRLWRATGVILDKEGITIR